jgi:hypothetical protein
MLDSPKNNLQAFIGYLKRHFIFWRTNPSKQIKKDFRKVIHRLSLEDRFTQIYNINYWGSKESVSGQGSTLALTNNLRKHLPDLFNQFSIKRVFDGPCGDFNWMKLVVTETNVDYTGGDIVLPMIEENQSKYAKDGIRFVKIDLTQDPIPNADLMICRDCLFHLSYVDTKQILENFVNSNTPYLLTTTYENKQLFKNKDIVTGHFRMIDLFSEPYHFPKDILFKIDDWIAPENPRFMCLWTRAQVITGLESFNKYTLI